jgi:hypothetical protein
MRKASGRLTSLCGAICKLLLLLLRIHAGKPGIGIDVRMLQRLQAMMSSLSRLTTRRHILITRLAIHTPKAPP